MNKGIYTIKNLIDNKQYIGSSIRLLARWIQHRNALRRNSHFNIYLQRAWNKYGEQSFTFSILEECEFNLIQREEYWIDLLKTFNPKIGYNFCRYPRASRLGCKARPETIEKMRKSLSGENHPMWGKHLKSSTKSKISSTQIGIPKPTSGAKKEFLVINPNGIEIKITGIRKFCRDNNLSHSSLWRVINGKQSEYKGWTQVKKY